MVMMSLPNGTMVHSCNANDLLDKEQVMAMNKLTYEDPSDVVYHNLLKEGLAKGQPYL